jgi:hypothetical protein
MTHRTAAAIARAGLALTLHVPLAAQSPEAAVIVHNRAGIPAAQMSEAKIIVNRIYSSAGVRLVWYSVNATLRRIAFSGPKLRLMVVTEAAANRIGYPANAVAFTPGHRRPGALAYVLEHRVRAVARGYSVSPAAVLGAAMAHEIGHMLLKSGHTESGLMRAEFNQADFRRLARGELLLTADVSRELRARLLAFPVDVLAASARALER